MKALSLIALFACIIAAGTIRWALDTQNSSSTPLVEKSAQPVVATPIPTPGTKPSASSTPTTALPAASQLQVAFTSQAPFGVWDPLHEDACEEASFLMVQHYLNGAMSINKEVVDAEIQDFVHWQEARGYGLSITLNDLNTVVAAKYGLKTGQVTRNVTAQDIKREIVAGRPVILGMAGKLLANPNFKDGGPIYHMLVVTGYDATGFVTNDPGTRLGEDYHYDYDLFMNAIHDWDAENILNGGRSMLTFR
jgi:hypothetical protein